MFKLRLALKGCRKPFSAHCACTYIKDKKMVAGRHADYFVGPLSHHDL